MKDIYILKRSISDIDWEDSYNTDLFMSHDEELLEKIADILNEQHLKDEHVFNYWVTKGPGFIENFEVFENHKEDLLDYWEGAE